MSQYEELRAAVAAISDHDTASAEPPSERTAEAEGAVVDAETIKKIEAGFKKLQEAKDCKSLLKKHFTEATMNACKGRKAKLGATLWDVIQSGVVNLDSRVGVCAPDAEAYTLFKELFDPLIADLHGCSLSAPHPPTCFGEGKTNLLPDLDPEGMFINSTRIRVCRMIKWYPFNPCLTEANYLEMQARVKKALDEITDAELKGTYYPLEGMSKKTQNQLVADHFLFKAPDRFLLASNGCLNWPKGRGIYHNTDKTFLVWVNEEDHLRIISMQNGGNVGQVLDRLRRGVTEMEKQLAFVRDDRLGWLAFCPTNIGSTVRASALIRLPKISPTPEFKRVCDEMKLQIRDGGGETGGALLDLSNEVRLGLTEFEAVKQMYDGVKRLIEMEKAAT